MSGSIFFDEIAGALEVVIFAVLGEAGCTVVVLSGCGFIFVLVALAVFTVVVGLIVVEATTAPF